MTPCGQTKKKTVMQWRTRGGAINTNSEQLFSADFNQKPNACNERACGWFLFLYAIYFPFVGCVRDFKDVF